MTRFSALALACAMVLFTHQARAADKVSLCKAEVARVQAQFGGAQIGADYETPGWSDGFCARLAKTPHLQSEDIPHYVTTEMSEQQQRARYALAARITADTERSVPGFSLTVNACTAEAYGLMQRQYRFYGQVVPLALTDPTLRLICARMPETARRSGQGRSDWLRAALATIRARRAAGLPPDKLRQYQDALAAEQAYLDGPHKVACSSKVVSGYAARYLIPGRIGILRTPEHREFRIKAKYTVDHAWAGVVPVIVAHNVPDSDAILVWPDFDDDGVLASLNITVMHPAVGFVGNRNTAMGDFVVVLTRDGKTVASEQVTVWNPSDPFDPPNRARLAVPMSGRTDSGTYAVEVRSGTATGSMVNAARIAATPQALTRQAQSVIAASDPRFIGTRFDASSIYGGSDDPVCVLADY